MPVNAVGQPVGVIADKSLEILATALDPLVQVLVAISFYSFCYFSWCLLLFYVWKFRKAWNTIMNAGLGYCLIQMSPLFLEILKTIGEAM